MSDAVTPLVLQALSSKAHAELITGLCNQLTSIGRSHPGASVAQRRQPIHLALAGLSRPVGAWWQVKWHPDCPITDKGAKSVVEPSGLLTFDADSIGKSRIPDDEKGSPEGCTTLFAPSSITAQSRVGCSTGSNGAAHYFYIARLWKIHTSTHSESSSYSAGAASYHWLDGAPINGGERAAGAWG
jgi:hypothetical protein